MVYDTNDGSEYWSEEILAKERNNYLYVVLSSFAQPLEADNFDISSVAKVLYKGDSEKDAAKAWNTGIGRHYYIFNPKETQLS